MNQKRGDLMVTITWALEDMKAEYGESFKIENVNLAELQRRTGILNIPMWRSRVSGETKATLLKVGIM